MRFQSAQHTTPSRDDRPVVLTVLHSLQRGGAEVLAARLAAELRDCYRFVIAALDDSGPLAEEFHAAGADTHVIGRRPGFDYACGKRLADLVVSTGAALIHAHQYTPYVYSALASARVRGRVPLIFTEHGRHQPDRPRIKRIIANRLYLLPRTHTVTAVADAVRTALIDHESIPARRIQVIRNGICLDRFHPLFSDADRDDRLALRRALAVADHQSLILHVAGFRPVKDHETAVAALAHLRRDGRDAILAFAGDGPLRAEIEAKVAREGLTHAVRFLGARDDVPGLWRAADLGLLTSHSEGLSVAAMEAAASGIPMVATCVGGNGEAIAHGSTGLLAPVANAPAIADAMRQLLTNPLMHSRLGRDAHRRAAELFDERRMHREYEHLYDRALGRATEPWEVRRVA